MPRLPLLILTTCLFAHLVMAADSLQVTVPQARVADTVYVIPAGPVAGSFTPSARVAVVDTIAGWAKIQIEGWVPVGAVMDRLDTSQGPFQPANLIEKSSKQKEYRQCEAITRKGTRCTRRAIGTTRYCWQHTRK